MNTLTTARAILRGDVRLAGGATSRRYSAGPVTVGWQPGTDLDPVLTDWTASAAVARAVMFNAQNLASVPMVVELADGEVTDDHPIALLWNQGPAATPDRPIVMSARVVRETLYARAELQGQSFAYLERDSFGVPLGIHPIYDPVQIVTTDPRAGDRDAVLRGGVEGFIVSHRGGTRIPLLPDEVLWLRYPHPTIPYAALAPWRAAMWAANADAAARRWIDAEFRNGARPSAVVNLGTVTPEVYERALAELRSRVDGAANAGKTLLTATAPGGVPASYARLSLTPEEMSYLESRKANADEVFLAFGLSPDLFRPGSTFENRREAKRAAWSETLLPKLDVAASEVDRQLAPTREETVGFDLSEVPALQESRDAVVTRTVSAVNGDTLTIDEARAELGRDPLPGGVGAFTITPYRQRAAMAAVADVAVTVIDDGEERPERMIRRGGRTVVRRGRRAVRTVRATVDTVTAVERMYARHERIGKREVAKLAKRQERDVLRALKKLARSSVPDAERTLERTAVYGRSDDGTPWTFPAVVIPDGQRVTADDLFDSVYWRAETMRALESWLEGAWSEGGQRLADKLGVSWDHLDPLVLVQMHLRLATLATHVTETTRQILQAQVLDAGVLEGESIAQLRDRILGTFDGLAKWRAELIARTEVVGGCNAASNVVARETGVVTGRTWLATKDARTRDTHRELDGVRVGLDEPYPNGCRFPGDPDGPAAETINCRCVELYDTDTMGA